MNSLKSHSKTFKALDAPHAESTIVHNHGTLHIRIDLSEQIHVKINGLSLNASYFISFHFNVALLKCTVRQGCTHPAMKMAKSINNS